jgi:predicted Zn-dependent protease
MSYYGNYPPQRPIWVRLVPVIFALVAAGFVLVKGCQRGPFGRQQVVALNPQEEAALGAQAFQQVLSESRGNVVAEQDETTQVVRRIGLRLARAAEDPAVLEHLQLRPQKFQWDFRVIRSSQVNAFCLPAGKVVVYTGILPVCETEAGLATVMGHEIGHALAHHGAERMAQQQLVQIGARAAAQSMGDLSWEQQRQVMGILGAGSQYGILLPFSRSHESEADHIGLLLLAAAGYDPKEAVAFWSRMEQKSNGGKTPEFTSTHPSHEHRIRDLQGWQKEAAPFYERVRDKPDGKRSLPVRR